MKTLKLQAAMLELKQAVLLLQNLQTLVQEMLQILIIQILLYRFLYQRKKLEKLEADEYSLLVLTKMVTSE
jgi:hypothetical protein